MRHTRWLFFVAVVAALLSGAPAALAQKRVALVVGNSAYRHTPELVNPRNDAADIAATLRAHGFQVVDGVDLDKAAFDRKVGDFAVALKGADAGVFFYAGHGLQVAGVNYLVPIDAQAEDEVRLDLEMVRVDVVQRIMERQTESNVLFLDACRDNPMARTLARNLARRLGTRSVEVGRGLRQVEAGVGTLISFATEPGNVALDGSGRNSPYTGALIRHLAAAKGDLNVILIDVRKDVIAVTRNRQVPWEHSALTAPFYFNAPPAPAAAAATGAAPASQPRDPVQEEWARVDKSSMAELETFRRRHPSSPEAEYAGARIEGLRKLEARGKEPAVATSPPRLTGPVAEGPAAGVATDRMLALLSGSWKGVFFYPNASQKPVDFALSMQVQNNVCRGRTEEPNTFGAPSAPKLFADVDCHLIAGTAQPRLILRKVYDGTGGQSHAVDYEGELSSDGRSVSGTWRIGATAGRFMLSRQ